MKIAIIGGGASGLIAAGSAKNATVTLFERNEKLGKKIYITGKGRCNFTNVCDNETFLSNVVVNSRFLRSALSKFTPYDVISILEENGCKTKIERGRRAFPFSDKASDVIKALTRYAESNNVTFKLNSNVTKIEKSGSEFIVYYNEAVERFDRVIICCGGASYPITGSNGTAYSLLKDLGHTIVKPVPSLVGLKLERAFFEAEGLTLKNVSVNADGIKPIFGDLMITHDGISGPIVLTMSAYLSRRETPYDAYIDFKPALSKEELDARILRDFSEQKNKAFKNSLDGLLPKSIIPYVVAKCGISPLKSVNSITRAERMSLIDVLKSYKIKIIGNEGFDRAVVTSGGVDVKEVQPKNMMSKLCKGLYICGEMLDIDALTGGYNLHIAFATGYVAGASASGDIYD